MKKKKNNKSEIRLIPQYSEITREFIRITKEARKEYKDKEFKNKYKTLLN